MREHIEACLTHVDHGDSYIRIVVTRGSDMRFDLAPHADLKPNTVIYVNPIHAYPEAFFSQGIGMVLASVRRNLPSAVDPNIKTGNYMNNVLALMEARERGAQDAIMLNHEEMVTEATTSNIFMVKGGTVITPEVKSGLLEGVSRKLLLEIMEAQNISFQVKAIPCDELLAADEVFLTGTTKEVMPVTQIDQKPVGAGNPGPVTQRLMKLFGEEVDRLLAA